MSRASVAHRPRWVWAAALVLLPLDECRLGATSPPAGSDRPTPFAASAATAIEVGVEALLETSQTRDRIEVLQVLALDSASPAFGGYSGMVLDAGGESLLAVSDRGTWLSLGLDHDADGRLTAVFAARIAPILDAAGEAVEGRMARDAESLTASANGWIVGFEGEHRLWRYAPADRRLGDHRAWPLRAPRGIRHAETNSGLEAVTALPDGRLLAIAEEPIGGGGTLEGWIGGDSRRWRRLRLPLRGAFRPTSLAALPNGDAILVERSFEPAEGVRIRISRLAAAGLRPRATLARDLLAELDESLPVDNFEASDARIDSDGKVLLYLLADDNFSNRQRTLLMQVRLPGGG